MGRGGWGDAGPTNQGKKALAMQSVILTLLSFTPGLPLWFTCAGVCGVSVGKSDGRGLAGLVRVGLCRVWAGLITLSLERAAGNLSVW